MASNYTNINNAIPVINNFGLKAAQLLDARSAVADQETLASLLTDGYVAEGQITYVEADQTLWIVKSVNDVLTWVEIKDSDQVSEAISAAQIEVTMNKESPTTTDTLENITIDGTSYIPKATVVNNASTLAWGETTTIGTIDEQALTIVMPANPDTDTHYEAKTVVSNSATGTTNATSTTDGATYLNLIEDGTVRSSHLIDGAGSATVTAANGVITVTAVGETYSVARAGTSNVGITLTDSSGNAGTTVTIGTTTLDATDTTLFPNVAAVKEAIAVTNTNTTLAWGTSTKVATVNGVDLNITMPEAQSFTVTTASDTDVEALFN